MTTDDDSGRAATAPEATPQPGAGGRRAQRATAAPSWWHRSHPVFVPLSGFFTGLVLVILLPAAFGAVLTLFLDDAAVESLLPAALAVFAIPLVLVVLPRTRRFGRYLGLGMILTALVVLAVAALTLWVLVQIDA